ncbi:methyltransferase domain-containing protein [Croceicoccus ponticola]|uniref:Methyltransferase domain-containing protein n=2 Tax=Croceicoccus ponticola TaxID=2217664 RepID=A0A437H2S5_9SPHN|nr:methyltransferase domain-containing protein [Croceicoccus ponticola]
MDSADLPLDDYAALLADLSRVNAWTMAARPTLNFLDRVVPRGGRIRVLDVGFGHGDLLRRIAGWARACDVTADLVGIDLNPRSAPIARDSTPAEFGITYRTGDYRSLGGQGWDVIVSSLVAHHMSDDQLVEFLRFMEAEAALGWHVNDLHRHGFAYFGYPLLARVMRWHRIVREDGRLSIARSYRPDEWPPILARAGVEGAQVSRQFPFRLCVAKTR